ncbi:MAG: hypothetical protein IID31_11175 [Planctomycetes bacterium]|nr:hypothetical protein [Planctomycetota bacterium]
MRVVTLILAVVAAVAGAIAATAAIMRLNREPGTQSVLDKIAQKFGGPSSPNADGPGGPLGGDPLGKAEKKFGGDKGGSSSPSADVPLTTEQKLAVIRLSFKKQTGKFGGDANQDEEGALLDAAHGTGSDNPLRDDELNDFTKILEDDKLLEDDETLAL